MQKRILLLFTGFFICIFLIFSIACSEDKNLQFKKQLEIQQVKPKKPVKIHLKHSAEGKYTWEITGDDADEIVKADRRLRKLLKID